MLRQQQRSSQEKSRGIKAEPASKASENKNAKKIKLSYKEKNELTSLPEKIEKLEAEHKQLEQQAGSSKFYQQEKEEITKTLARMEKINKELETTYERWEHLDSTGK